LINHALVVLQKTSRDTKGDLNALKVMITFQKGYHFSESLLPAGEAIRDLADTFQRVKNAFGSNEMA